MRNRILFFIFCILLFGCNNSSSGGGGSGGSGKGFLSEKPGEASPSSITTACQFSPEVCAEFLTGTPTETKASIDMSCSREGGTVVATCNRKPGGFQCSVAAEKDSRGAVNYYISPGGAIEDIQLSCEQIGGQLKKL